jgi:hypothetical protein
MSRRRARSAARARLVNPRGDCSERRHGRASRRRDADIRRGGQRSASEAGALGLSAPCRRLMSRLLRPAVGAPFRSSRVSTHGRVASISRWPSFRALCAGAIGGRGRRLPVVASRCSALSTRTQAHSTTASCPVMASAGSPGGRVEDTKHSTGTVNLRLSHGVGSTLLVSEKSHPSSRTTARG